MKKEVSALLIILFLLPAILAASEAAKTSEDLQKEINKAAYHAVQYHAGNENYAEYTANINQVENKINSVLISSSDQDLNEANLKQVLGDPSSQTDWISKTQDEEIKTDKPVSVWTDRVIFDGKQQLKYSLTPALNENNKVSYNIKFSTDFVQSKPIINLKNEISDIEKTAKEFSLNPDDIQKANQLAETSVNVENLFKDYVKLSPVESCEQTMSDLLGGETKTSQVQVVAKEFELSSKDNTKVIARTEICEKCDNIDYFVNLKMRIEKNNNILEYPGQSPSASQFENLDSTGFKRAIIDSNQVLQEMISSGNYESAYSVMKRMELLNDLWAQKANNADEKTKIENFADRNGFLQSLFVGLPVKTSLVEQTTFEKTLVQEFKVNGEEICTNQIDDNNDQLVDCADNLCTGKVCGTQTINVTNENITTQEQREMYCTLGQCQLKEESKAEASLCGNNKCEQGENETCVQDCKTCPVYPPIECSGELISKGEDANGCPLAPVCLEKKDSCSSSDECTQPLCGKAECINGKCETTELNLCQESVCVEGEKKSEACDSGESLVIERCINGNWKSTGLKCDIAVSGPMQVIRPLGTECKIASDCTGGNSQCVLGRCQPITIKKSAVQDSSESSVVKGISFTGDSIQLTTEVLTGVVPDPTNPNVLGEAKDYKRPLPKGTGSSFLTGVSRTDNPAQIAQTNTVDTTANPQAQNIIKINSNEKNVFGVTGVCIKNKDGVTPILKFEGGGDQFKTISQLQNSYETGGTEAYCRWKLENLLRERKELEKSFNEEFVKKYFEQDLPNFADDWENAHKVILDLNDQNIKNQIETAKMMECIGVKALDNYNLININYQNPLYGSLKYEEKLSNVRFSGMSNDVKIISPSIKEFVIFPSREFIKTELKKDMETGEFPGSMKSSAERKINKGLTENELSSLKSSQKVIGLIKKITADAPDGNLAVQLKVVDSNNDVLYNLYIKANENEIIKAQPLTPANTPNKNVEMTIGFEEVYNILQNARKRSYSQDAPWEEGKINPSTIIKSTTDWIGTQIKIINLMNSVSVSPSQYQGDIKDLFKQVFFAIGEGESSKTAVSTSPQTQIVWGKEGQTTAILA
ncbi:hypothetical protein HY212_02135 [Candidatus Pacearchaeota archaeon]|nr:hypothetical protein [Candidatus Pacearchaeota archaeon]